MNTAGIIAISIGVLWLVVVLFDQAGTVPPRTHAISCQRRKRQEKLHTDATVGTTRKRLCNDRIR